MGLQNVIDGDICTLGYSDENFEIIMVICLCCIKRDFSCEINLLDFDRFNAVGHLGVTLREMKGFQPLLGSNKCKMKCGVRTSSDIFL